MRTCPPSRIAENRHYLAVHLHSAAMVAAGVLVLGRVVPLLTYGISGAAGNSAAPFSVLAHGVGIDVLASSLATENAAIITFAVLAIALVVLTSPVSGHAVARSARRRTASRR